MAPAGLAARARALMVSPEQTDAMTKTASSSSKASARKARHTSVKELQKALPPKPLRMRMAVPPLSDEVIRSDVDSTPMSAVTTSTPNAITNLALEKSEQLLAQLTALGLEGEDCHSMADVKSRTFSAISCLEASVCSSRCSTPTGQVATVELPVQVVDLLMEAWAKYRQSEPLGKENTRLLKDISDTCRDAFNMKGKLGDESFVEGKVDSFLADSLFGHEATATEPESEHCSTATPKSDTFSSLSASSGSEQFPSLEQEPNSFVASREDDCTTFDTPTTTAPSSPSSDDCAKASQVWKPAELTSQKTLPATMPRGTTAFGQRDAAPVVQKCPVHLHVAPAMAMPPALPSTVCPMQPALLMSSTRLPMVRTGPLNCTVQQTVTINTTVTFH